MSELGITMASGIVYHVKNNISNKISLMNTVFGISSTQNVVSEWELVEPNEYGATSVFITSPNVVSIEW